MIHLSFDFRWVGLRQPICMGTTPVVRRTMLLMALAFVCCLGCNNNTTTTNTTASSPKPSSNAVKRIVLLNNTDSPFWDAARAGIQQAVEDLKLKEAGYTASMDSNDGTEQGQIEKLRQYGTQKDIWTTAVAAKP